MAGFISALATILITHRVTNSILANKSNKNLNHIDRITYGLIRLYITILIPWISWFGYEAYRYNGNVIFERIQYASVIKAKIWLEDHANDQQSPIIFEGRTLKQIYEFELEVARLVWDAKSNDDIYEAISASIEKDVNELTRSIYSLLASAAPWLLYPLVRWLIAGFEKRPPDDAEASPGR